MTYGFLPVLYLLYFSIINYYTDPTNVCLIIYPLESNLGPLSWIGIYFNNSEDPEKKFYVCVYISIGDGWTIKNRLFYGDVTLSVSRPIYGWSNF